MQDLEMPSATPAPEPTLLDLAKEATAHAAVIDKFLKARELPQPSFHRDGPSEFPVPSEEAEIHAARIALIDTAKKLYDLALGPTDQLSWTVLTSKYDCASLRAVVDFHMAEAVPLDGEATFEEIARATGLDPEFVARIVRYAVTIRVFHEHRPGAVVHTAASAELVRNPLARAGVGHNMNDCFVATAKLNEAAAFVAGGEPNRTAFNLAHNFDGTFFEFLARPENEQRKRDFHEYMSALAAGQAFAAHHVAKAKAWNSVPDGGLVVDVGGSHGHISAALARAHKNLRFLVQDLPEVVGEGKASIAKDLEVADRIEFMGHSFLHPQTESGDVYLLRAILHDWSDKYCITILQNLMKAMRPDSRIVLVENILSPPNTAPSAIDRLHRSLDLQMMTLMNSRERNLEEWKDLLARAGPLEILDVEMPRGSALSIITVGMKS